MSKIFTQLSGTQEESPKDQDADTQKPATRTQLELELPGVPPAAPATQPIRARRTSRTVAAPAPAAEESGLREFQAKLTDAQAALARNEATLASMCQELAAETEARQRAQSGFTALQQDLKVLKDQRDALTTERDRFQKALTDLQAKTRPDVLTRQRQDIEARIRQAVEPVEQARQALAAEQRLWNEERRQAAARIRELNEQLLGARRTELPPGRAEQTRIALMPIAIAAAVVLAVGVGAFLFGRHQGRPADDFRAAGEILPDIIPVPPAVPAALEPGPGHPASLPGAETGGGQIIPAQPAAAGASLPAIKVNGLQVKPVDNGLKIVFDKGVFTRRAALSDEARTVLKQLAGQLRPDLLACRIEITGHTDPEPVRDGNVADNWALGQQRAHAVEKYLTTECSLPADALTTASAGDVNAPYPNTTPELRRKNRTVTIRVIPR